MMSLKLESSEKPEQIWPPSLDETDLMQGSHRPSRNAQGKCAALLRRNSRKYTGVEKLFCNGKPF